MKLQEEVNKIVKILHDNGLSDEEVQTVLRQFEDVLYEHVIDKIIDGLDEEHYVKLDEMMREGKSAQEIVQVLPVREEWFNELYMKKLDECVHNLEQNTNFLQQSLQ